MGIEISPEDWAMAGAVAVLLNLLTFGAFAWDKASARRGGWRVSESTLLWLALIGGIIGALAGQRLLRHKTRKELFRTQLYSIAGLQLCVLVLIAVPQTRAWLTSAIAADMT